MALIYENGSRTRNQYEYSDGDPIFKKMLDSNFDKFRSPTGSLTYATGEVMTPDMKSDFTEVIRRSRQAQLDENPNLTVTGWCCF